MNGVCPETRCKRDRRRAVRRMTMELGVLRRVSKGFVERGGKTRTETMSWPLMVSYVWTVARTRLMMMVAEWWERFHIDIDFDAQ